MNIMIMMTMIILIMIKMIIMLLMIMIISGEAFHFLSSEPGGEIQYDETCRSFEKKQKGPSR